MASLREVQLAFADAVFGREPIPPAAFAALGAAEAARFAIYRRGVFEHAISVLREAYPVVHRLVGDDFFGFAAREYVRGRGSASGDRHDLGAHLAGFLRFLPQAQAHPFLPDVARLEWAVYEVCHAADARGLDAGALSRVPEDRYCELRFSLHPAARLVTSPFPILRIWEANQPERDAGEVMNLGSGPIRLLVLRRGGSGGDEEPGSCPAPPSPPALAGATRSGAAGSESNKGPSVAILPLGLGNFAFLHALARSESLASAASRAMEADPVFDLSACLSAHLLGGVFCALVLPETLPAARPD